MLCGVVAVARAASGPAARESRGRPKGALGCERRSRERAREGDRRGRRAVPAAPSGRGWGGPRLRCGAGLEGAAARAMHGDVRTARSERSERLRTAASRASRRGWGFQVSLLSTVHLYTTPLRAELAFINCASILRCAIYARYRALDRDPCRSSSGFGGSVSGDSFDSPGRSGVHPSR